jgi:regulatory protein
VVAALVPDARRPGAVRVQAGECAWTVAAADADHLGLAPGVALDAAVRERLEAAADVEASLRMALRALGRRAFARHDLGRRLVRKGHPAPAVEAALERLAAMGLLDDDAYARDYVALQAARGRGPGRLRRDLAAMGVERGTVDGALAGAALEASAGSRALALATRRAAQLQGLPRIALRRRLLAFLARRGYGGEAARQAVAQVVR